MYYITNNSKLNIATSQFSSRLEPVTPHLSTCCFQCFLTSAHHSHLSAHLFSTCHHHSQCKYRKFPLLSGQNVFVSRCGCRTSQFAACFTAFLLTSHLVCLALSQPAPPVCLQQRPHFCCQMYSDTCLTSSQRKNKTLQFKAGYCNRVKHLDCTTVKNVGQEADDKNNTV